MADGYNKTGTNAPLTDAQAQQAFQQTQNAAANSIINAASVKLEKDKDGHIVKGHVLGMDVSPESASLINYVLQLAPDYIDNFLKGGAYKHSKEALEYASKKLDFSLAENESRDFGLRAAASVSALLICFQPLMELVHGVSESSKKKGAIQEEVADVIASDKEHWKNNEVIKTALERSDTLMWNGVKTAVSMLPTVFLNGMYARQRHKDLVADKIHESNINIAKNASHNDFLSAANADRKFDEEVAAAEAKFFKENKYESKDAKEQARLDASWARTEERLRKNREDVHSVKKAEKPIQENDQNKLLALNVAGLAGIALGQSLKSDDAKKTCAYSLIKQLQARVSNGNIGSRDTLTKEVLEIFQQNEVDRGRPRIGKVLLEKFEPIAERIGEVIAKGELDPMALVNFVGSGKVINKRAFVSTEKLEEIIDEQRRILGSHEKTPYDEFMADFQHPDKIMQVIVDNIKTLDGDEKALLATVLSDEILLRAGERKKDILPMRERGHDLNYDFAIKRTKELAAKSPEVLKDEYIFSDKEIRGLNDFNKMIEAGDQEKVKSEIDSGKYTKLLVRASLQEMEKGKSWTEIVGSPSKKKLLDALKPEKIEKHDKEAANDEEYGHADKIKHSRSHHEHQQHEGRV